MAEQAGPYPYKVNDVELRSDKPQLPVLEIMTLAKAKDAFPKAIDQYLLVGDKKTYQLSDDVDLREDNILRTILNGPGPVASYD